MLLISFNVNSIRSRMHQLTAVIDRYQPDIIGLQETKVVDDDFPAAAIAELGYQCSYFGQKTHYGVALLSRTPALEVQRGFGTDDDTAQRRFIAADYEIEGHRLHVVNAYFPQGESREHPTKFPAKAAFYADLRQYLLDRNQPEQALAVMGDFNVAPEDIDIGIGADNAKRWLRSGKCSFLPEEREWYSRLIDGGLGDTYRLINPDSAALFSWFDYRSRGFEAEPKRGLRIDMILSNPALNRHLQDAGIDYDIRGMDKPSDHCPIWARYELADRRAGPSA